MSGKQFDATHLALEEELKRLELEILTNAGGISAVWATRAAIRAAIKGLAAGRGEIKECGRCESEHWKDEDGRHINSEEFEECFGILDGRHIIVSFRLEYLHDDPTSLYPIAVARVTGVELEERTWGMR
jgi:hypothetical protein